MYVYDLDIGGGGFLIYFIIESDIIDGKYFSIDFSIGFIRMKEIFDCEVVDEKYFIVLVEVRDKGGKFGRSYVDIEVVDDNDVGLVFVII